MSSTEWRHVGRMGVEPHPAQPNMHDAFTPSWGGTEAPCLGCGNREVVRLDGPVPADVTFDHPITVGGVPTVERMGGEVNQEWLIRELANARTALHELRMELRDPDALVRRLAQVTNTPEPMIRTQVGLRPADATNMPQWWPATVDNTALNRALTAQTRFGLEGDQGVTWGGDT